MSGVFTDVTATAILSVEHCKRPPVCLKGLSHPALASTAEATRWITALLTSREYPPYMHKNGHKQVVVT